MPTDYELDALEAFQLSLGRQEDVDLNSIYFKSEVAELGKEIFLNVDENNPQAGKCHRCHGNAGANSSTSFFNGNRDTGVEFLPDQPARLVDPTIPIDGGFGTEPNPSGGFGNGKFNITTVIESADTPPFFHNNSINTLEEAVNFYNTEVFNNAADGGINNVGFTKLEATQVQAIAAFIRVINALENIRSSNNYDNRVKNMNPEKGRRLLKIAISETSDAIEVLRGGVFLHPDAIILLKIALQFEKLAYESTQTGAEWLLSSTTIHLRNILIDKAIAKKNEAYNLMVF